MESMTLTPTQEQILDFVHTYRNSLTQSKNPHMDYFFRLEGATVSIYKSGKVLLQGNDLTPYPVSYTHLDVYKRQSLAKD